MGSFSNLSQNFDLHGIWNNKFTSNAINTNIRYFADTDNFLLSIWNSPNTGKWQIAMMIAIPIAVLCFIVIVLFMLTIYPNKWTGRNAMRYHYAENGDAQDQQPILGISSLRDMIEMTTSGSGSGENG